MGLQDFQVALAETKCRHNKPLPFLFLFFSMSPIHLISENKNVLRCNEIFSVKSPSHRKHRNSNNSRSSDNEAEYRETDHGDSRQ